MYAIGGSEQSAILMGLPVGRTKVIIYTMNSTLAALAGVVYTSVYGVGVSVGDCGVRIRCDRLCCDCGRGFLLLTGGAGYVEGTLVGVLILGLIQTFITFQGTLSSWWTKIVIGILLFIFITLQTYLSKTSIKQEA